jgi:hypothetical protein
MPLTARFRSRPISTQRQPNGRGLLQSGGFLPSPAGRGIGRGCKPELIACPIEQLMSRRPVGCSRRRELPLLISRSRGSGICADTFGTDNADHHQQGEWPEDRSKNKETEVQTLSWGSSVAGCEEDRCDGTVEDCYIDDHAVVRSSYYWLWAAQLWSVAYESDQAAKIGERHAVGIIAVLTARNKSSFISRAGKPGSCLLACPDDSGDPVNVLGREPSIRMLEIQ